MILKAWSRPWRASGDTRRADRELAGAIEKVRDLRSGIAQGKSRQPANWRACWDPRPPSSVASIVPWLGRRTVPAGAPVRRLSGTCPARLPLRRSRTFSIAPAARGSALRVSPDARQGRLQALRIISEHPRDLGQAQSKRAQVTISAARVISSDRRPANRPRCGRGYQAVLL